MMIPSWYPKPGAPLLGTFYKEQAEALAAKGIEVAVAHVSVGSGMVHLSGLRRKVINGVLTYTYTQLQLHARMGEGQKNPHTHAWKPFTAGLKRNGQTRCRQSSLVPQGTRRLPSAESTDSRCFYGALILCADRKPDSPVPGKTACRDGICL